MNNKTSFKALSLDGEWRFFMGDTVTDVPSSVVIPPDYNDSIELPGTTATRRKGQPKPVRYEDNLTIPYSYTGTCWYERDILIPLDWANKRIKLIFERTKYTKVWLDDIYIGDNLSWCAPQEYILGSNISPGQHKLTVMVDNSRLPVKGAADSHMWSDNTQGNWNGIIGNLSLTVTDSVWLDNIRIYPDYATKSIDIRVKIAAADDNGGEAGIVVIAEGEGITDNATSAIQLSWGNGDKPVANIHLPLGEDAALWDEFNPVLHNLTIRLTGNGFIDEKKLQFGLRNLVIREKQFAINGRTTFLRGKHDACVFPLTGHPPMSVDEWVDYFSILKRYGLNRVRFHTWTPPGCAFEAADRIGFYLQPELPFWGHFSEDVRAALEPEAKRILDSYGNHPSFVMFAMGNEPWAGHDVINGLITELRAYDNRFFYIEGAGVHKPVAEDDYILCSAVSDENHRMLHVRGANAGYITDSHIQAGPPNTMIDYSDAVNASLIPVITHEMGQYTVYPNYDEIDKYQGACKPYNLESFRNKLIAQKMEHLGLLFHKASGQLASLCYREEIESCLRTAGHGGFDLLDLSDFPGQGTALVGILDAFLQSKNIISEEEWRRFCAPVVVLARFEKYVWCSDESFTATIDLANFSNSSIEGEGFHASIIDENSNELGSVDIDPSVYYCGGLRPVGKISIPLSGAAKPMSVRLVLSLNGTDVQNSYPLWVYPPPVKDIVSNKVYIARSCDSAMLSALSQGESVVLVCHNELPLARSVGGAFASDFWNFRFFHNEPGTMGILCDPSHPAFESFPTSYHSNWNWFAILQNAQPLILDEYAPAELEPILRQIDNYDRCHRLGLIFEASVGAGKLLVVTSDLLKLGSDHIEARQLLESLVAYAESDRFIPAVAIEPSALQRLLRTSLPIKEAIATASSTDPAWQGFSAAQLLDGNESRGWRADPKADGDHWCKIQIPCLIDFGSMEILWDEDKPGYRYKVLGSHDDNDWFLLSDQTNNTFTNARHEFECFSIGCGYVKIVIEAVPYDRSPMIMEVRFFPPMP